MTSRPSGSAPSRYSLRRPGPIGVPSGVTTNVFLPSISIVPVAFVSVGPRPATCFA